jgi:hypothetical protein
MRLMVEKPRSTQSAEEKRRATAAVGTLKYDLTGKLMTELRYLAKSVGMDQGAVVRSCWEMGGGTNLELVARHLKAIHTYIAVELKAVDDRVLEDIPNAGAMILRLQFIDGKSVMAMSTAKLLGIEDRLERERVEASKINSELKRYGVAAKLDSTKILLRHADFGVDVTVIERGGHSRHGASLRI